MRTLSVKTRILNSIRNIAKMPAIENYLASKTQGKTIHNFYAKLLPNNYQYDTNSIRYAKRDGIEFCLDISDYMEYVIYFGLVTEPREKLYGLVKENSTILDIGTNIGETLLNFAKRNTKGRIYGFEPVPYLFRRVTKNISLNPFKNIEVNNIALSNTAETLYFDLPTNNNSGGINMNKVASGTSEKVEARTLDSFIAEKGITATDLIKIDVEGFEMNVLEGAKNTLEQFSPTLFIELDDSNLRSKGSSSKELVSFLKDRNYRIFRADDDAEINPSTDFSNCHFDIICKK